MKRRAKVLVVEDDPTVARGLKALLDSHEYATHLAANGEEGLKFARTSTHDVVLLDVDLPTISGIEVCRQMRSQGFSKPIIMVTAQDKQINKVIGFESGADDYVTKPFDSRELLSRIEAHLRTFERQPKQRAALTDGGNTRKLLSIMFTDIKGYSKGMSENEARSLRLLNVHNAKVTHAIEKHRGRVVEVIGDAFLAAFDNALDALQCGNFILRDLATYNSKRHKSEQIHIRIGIHLGDVIESDGKLRGNTINIAARLQQLATPDRINISESVFHATRGSLDIKATRLGLRKLKNIRKPMVIYRVAI